MTVKAEEVAGIARNAIAAHSGLSDVSALTEHHIEWATNSPNRVLREWAAVLRIVSDPKNMPYVHEQLRETGPLMGHDLRNRVILADVDRLIAEAQAAGQADDAPAPQHLAADAAAEDTNTPAVAVPRERCAS